jgi:hypothetical protein
MMMTLTMKWQEKQGGLRHDVSAKLPSIARKATRNFWKQEVHLGEDDGTLYCGGKVT